MAVSFEVLGPGSTGLSLLAYNKIRLERRDAAYSAETMIRWDTLPHVSGLCIGAQYELESKLLPSPCITPIRSNDNTFL